MKKVEQEYWNTNLAAVFAGLCLVMIAVGFVTYTASEIGFISDVLPMAQDVVTESRIPTQLACTNATEEAGDYHTVTCASKAQDINPKPL